MRILVAEDNKQSAKLIQILLEDLAAENISVVYDGQEAWNQINGEGELITGNASRKRQFDLVICDWNMPEMTGLELLKKTRREGYFMPIIMITGRGTVDSVISAVESGVTEFLPKPFTPLQLTQKIIAVFEDKE
jgi:two-component system chemotaxis response regulator CheY